VPSEPSCLLGRRHLPHLNLVSSSSSVHYRAGLTDHSSGTTRLRSNRPSAADAMRRVPASDRLCSGAKDDLSDGTLRRQATRFKWQGPLPWKGAAQSTMACQRPPEVSCLRK
jgi:hypothetical protein